MFGVSGGELIILLLIGLIVLGPERLPRVANQIGGWLGQARRMTRVMKRQLEEELDLNQTLSINPPTKASREPSFKNDPPKTPAAESSEAPGEEATPDYPLPHDDDTYSPAHDADSSMTTDTPDEAVTGPVPDTVAQEASPEKKDVSVEPSSRKPEA